MKTFEILKKKLNHRHGQDDMDFEIGEAKHCPDKKEEIDLYEKSESCDNEKCESEWWPEL